MKELYQYIDHKYTRFDPVIQIGHRTGGRDGILLADFQYVDRMGVKHLAVAPMPTDGGTIWHLPRVTRYITGSPWGRFLAAFVIHDYYCLHPELLNRKEADLLFHEMLVYLGANRFAAWAMYRGVRIGASWGGKK